MPKSKNNSPESIEVINLHKDHRKRMDNRYKKTQFLGWSEYEILEYLLYTVFKQKDTVPLAHKLLGHFGTLDNVLEADIDELIKVDGIGIATARYLSVVGALTAHRYSSNDIPKKFDLATDATIRYVKKQFYGEKMEIFIMICLDSRNQLIKTDTLFRGNFSYMDINVSNTAHTVVRTNAAKVIFAHNHPSGDPTPSEDDILTTEWLVEAMSSCGIQVLDHIIVGKDDVCLIKHYLETGEFYPKDEYKPIKMRSYSKKK